MRGGYTLSVVVQQKPSRSPMQRPERTGEHHRHDQDAGPEDQYVSRAAQIEAADPADQQIGYDKIEEAPEHIDQGGGQAHTRRCCEGALEGVPRNPVDEMGQGIRQKCAGEEVSQIVVPPHCCPSPNARAMVAIQTEMPTGANAGPSSRGGGDRWWSESLTSPRLRGEVEIRGSEFRVRG
jgi:hypothetical protein